MTTEFALSDSSDVELGFEASFQAENLPGPSSGHITIQQEQKLPSTQKDTRSVTYNLGENNLRRGANLQCE